MSLSGGEDGREKRLQASTAAAGCLQNAGDFALLLTCIHIVDDTFLLLDDDDLRELHSADNFRTNFPESVVNQNNDTSNAQIGPIPQLFPAHHHHHLNRQMVL